MVDTKSSKPVKAMSSVVSFSPIRNPANPNRVFIYRVAPEVYSLGYDQRDLHKGISTPRWNKNPAQNVVSTQLQPKSNIVTLKFDDVIHVYGVCQETSTVALLSPFVEPVSPEFTSTNGPIAGCAISEDDVEQAWLAVQDDDMGEKRESRIWYHDVINPQSQRSKSSAKNVKSATALSLFHDTKRFWVIYQNNDGQLVAHNEKKQTPSIINSDSSQFAELTPIASCFIPACDIDPAKVPGFRVGALGRVIVYWVRQFNKKPCLYRAHADLTEKSSIADFSEPRQATENGVAVQEEAQIGVVTDPRTQANYLFVAKAGVDNISSVIDEWATKEECMHPSSLDLEGLELFKRWRARMLENAIMRNCGGGGSGGRHHEDEMMRRYSGMHLMEHDEDEILASKYGMKLLEDGLGQHAGSRRTSGADNGRMSYPLVWQNKGDACKPQIHNRVISKSASSRWSEAEVQVIIPAGSTIMGDVMVRIKVRPTD